MTNDDNLRTALKLSDEWDGSRYRWWADWRRYDAAHPAPNPPTPAPEKDADARALFRAVQTIKETGGAVEIAGVRIEPCDAYGRPENIPAPVSDTRREDDELVEIVARALSRSEHPGVQAYIDARAVLAVLPAPPVVDEVQIQDIIREAYDTHIDLGSPARRGEFVFTAAEVIAARLRGATRG